MTIKYIRVSLCLLASHSLTACDFLDVVPESNPTTDDIYETQCRLRRWCR